MALKPKDTKYHFAANKVSVATNSLLVRSAAREKRLGTEASSCVARGKETPQAQRDSDSQGRCKGAPGLLSVESDTLAADAERIEACCY